MHKIRHKDFTLGLSEITPLSTIPDTIAMIAETAIAPPLWRHQREGPRRPSAHLPGTSAALAGGYCTLHRNLRLDKWHEQLTCIRCSYCPGNT